MTNNIRIKKWLVLPALGLSLSFVACQDWIETESLDINSPSFEEQYPQLYADYLKDLNAYKASEHKISIAAIDNVANPKKQAERLSVMPDSLDVIVLNNPDGLGDEMLKEFETVRRKGTKVCYIINFDLMEETWNEMSKNAPALTEEDGLAFLTEQANEQIALAAKYNYDGIVAYYSGRSLVSLTEPELLKYTNRQAVYINALGEWKAQSGKMLIFSGNVEYLVPQHFALLKDCSYIALRTQLSTSNEALSLKADLALQVGEESKDLFEGVNPVPTDRFIAMVMPVDPEDKNEIIGYWKTVDENGKKMLAIKGGAWWTRQYSADFNHGGLYIMNMQNGYYDKMFAVLREAINIMNPSK